MQFFFIGGGLTDAIHVPDGANLADWYARVSPGQTLSLAAGGQYTLGAGVEGFSTMPNGIAALPITIQGNGATITGGAVGLKLTNKSYLNFYNLTVIDQSTAALQTNIADHLYFENCTFGFNTTQTGYVDVAKLFNLSESSFYRCTAYRGPSSVSNTQSLDGFETWPTTGVKANVVFEECTAYGFNLATNGHGFENYRDASGRYYTGVQYLRCTAYDCIRGFSVESGGVAGTSHTVTAEDCITHDNSECDYGVDGEASFTVTGESVGATACGDVIFA